MYGAADIAFVGGSLVNIGGHNLLEPAMFSIPVLSGNHLSNFSAISKLMQDQQALQIIDSPNHLAQAVITLFESPKLRQQKGLAAHMITQKHKGALINHMQHIAKLLNASSEPSSSS
jgi:3-deoxy-D-manno-octulosonic-acid transferase